jgi:DHA1 family bicyclomycin/chloramphenicol resistance-like MFS transporter
MTFGSVSALLTGPVGGIIAGQFDWQVAFIITASYAAALLILFSVTFKETIREKNLLAIDPVPFVINIAMLIRDRVFLSYVLVGATAWAGMSGFINSSPGLLIRTYGIAPLLGTLSIAAGGLAMLGLAVLGLPHPLALIAPMSP